LGLGLAIAREIAIGHGGGISVADSPAGGARFIITLPTTNQQAAIRNRYLTGMQ